MENATKTLSRFFEEKLDFFRQTEATLSNWYIYYVKPLFKMANSLFLRKFAQILRIDVNRGGSKLIIGVESSADHCGPRE